MSNRAARMVILCEDFQQHTFLYRLLTPLGFPRNRIRIEKVRDGEGAGDQFVRNRYPDEVTIQRRKSARMRIGLVTAIDADTDPIRNRYQELNDVLEANEQEHRQNGEKICILVPKRNIETWIYALFGRDANETETYPKLENEGDCQPAVEKLVAYLQGGWSNDLIPSLERGCRELNTRLPE
jgi:hypothetical protein